MQNAHLDWDYPDTSNASKNTNEQTLDWQTLRWIEYFLSSQRQKKKPLKSSGTLPWVLTDSAKAWSHVYILLWSNKRCWVSWLWPTNQMFIKERKQNKTKTPTKHILKLQVSPGRPVKISLQSEWLEARKPQGQCEKQTTGKTLHIVGNCQKRHQRFQAFTLFWDGGFSGSYVTEEGWVEQSGKLHKQRMEFKTNGVAPTMQRQRQVELLRS